MSKLQNNKIRRRNDTSTDKTIINSKITIVNDSNHHDDEQHLDSDLNGDKSNIAILFFLYLLQGIPIGLTAAIPMLLQNRGASYKQQAEFSFSHWPFSIKLLWAPIVDSLFWSKFGRRKSWLIPTQYLIGIFMLILSSHVNRWLGGTIEFDENGVKSLIQPNVQVLTMIFFALNFLAATQDIAVDGWALTMLKRCNVGHASTCNSVGQTAGYFLGYVAFMALESKEFCNTYLRTEPSEDGLVTLPGFLWFWGITFLVTTTLVALFKHENNITEHHYSNTEHPELDIKQTYSLLIDILKMKPIRLLIVILLTIKIGFAACDAVTSLKLIDAGVPKDKLALLVIPLVPLQIILPLLISKYTTGPKPMNVYLKAMPYRIFLTIIISSIVWMTPYIISDHNVPFYYYVLLLTNYAFYQITLYSMFVAVMAFFARISDPAVGGTYMTLLNTLANFGTNWPNTVVLWLVDVLTWRQCSITEKTDLNNSDNLLFINNNTCSNSIEKEECTSAGGSCNITIDGYYIECIICLIYGILWYHFGRSQIHYLQSLPTRVWHVIRKNKNHKSR